MGIPTFDDRAATWDDDPRKTERARLVAQAILERQKGHVRERVLDFGAGTGLLGMHFAQRGAAVTFVDPSVEMRRQIERKLREAGDARGESVADLDEVESQRFDLVVSLMALHHVEDPAATVARLGQCLAPGGALALCDLEPEDGSFHDPGTTGVHHGFSQEQLEAWCADGGLGAFSCQTVTQVARDSGRGMRAYPLFLMGAERER